MLLLAGKAGFLEPAGDQRSGARRKLRLQAVGSTAAEPSALVMIHDLSQTGILIETEAQLSPGETIHVELPYGDAREAAVVWCSDGLFGCQFEQPITKAAVSAALLKAPADGPISEATGEAYGSVAEADGDKLPPWRRALVIVGLAVLAWSPLVLGFAALAE